MSAVTLADCVEKYRRDLKGEDYHCLPLETLGCILQEAAAKIDQRGVKVLLDEFLLRSQDDDEAPRLCRHVLKQVDLRIFREGIRVQGYVLSGIQNQLKMVRETLRALYKIPKGNSTIAIHRKRKYTTYRKVKSEVLGTPASRCRSGFCRSTC